MRLVFYALLAATAAGAATTAFLAAEPPAGAPAGAPAAPPAAASTPAAPDPAELQAMQSAAATAQRGFAAEPGARLAVTHAIKAHDEETVKAILIHEGFTSDQAANARVVLRDHTGGGEPTDKVRVTITVTCCPMTITVTVSL